MFDDETMVRRRFSRLLNRERPADPDRRGDLRWPADPNLNRPSEPDPDRSPDHERPPEALPGPGAFDPGRRGVRALTVLAVVVVLVAAGWAWRSRPRTEPVPQTSAPASMAGMAGEPATDAAGGAAGPGRSAGPGSSDGVEIVVAVAGKVRRPGLVRLPSGSRVADALAAAGGPLPGTDAALLNLARKVTDGELILVGVTAPPGVAGAPGGPAGAAAPGGNGVAGAGGKVSLNTGTLAELDALPGVGPVLAQRIIDHREQRGGFRAISELRQVTGIGDARYEDLKHLVTL